VTDTDGGALLLMVRRDQAEMIHRDAFERYRSIETVVDRRYGERRARAERRVPDQRANRDRRVRNWVAGALAADGLVLVRR
jgi:hypothetical protein